MSINGAAWRIGIDVGGTFTDLAAVEMRSGARQVVKVPTTPSAPEEGVLAALDALAGRLGGLPPIESLAHSTTIATNALLGQMQLDLPRVAFVTTFGFRDVIEIGRQNRSEVYNLFVGRPRPLAAREDRIGVHERMDFRGETLEPLTPAECERVVHELRERSPDAVAIGFLHSYVNDAHERMMAAAIHDAFPGMPVTQSAQIDPEYREYERFSTALVNAALQPIVQKYLDRLQQALRERGIGASLYVMQSNGGMALAQRVAQTPAAIIESGPASGVIAASQLARDCAAQHVLSFDMGGTTAKAGTIIDANVQVANEFEAAGTTHSGRSVQGSGYPVRFPFVDLAEISAGGGTIAFVDEAGALRVGPLSAGADPGPACYGRSDRATVTDANVVLGRLSGTALAGGTLPVDASRSHAAIALLAQQLGLGVEATAAGIVRIVDAQMAKVLRIVTVERGYDPRDFVMVAFGGNGPLHACALAEELGIRRVLVPPDPGVFSAEGLLVAPVRLSFLRPLMQLTGDMQTEMLQVIAAQLQERGERELASQQADAHSAQFTTTFDARYRGQSFELPVAAAASGDAVAQQFHHAHARRYGYDVPGEAVEIVSMRVDAIAPARTLPPRTSVSQPRATTPDATRTSATRDVWTDGKFVQTPLHDRNALSAQTRIEGPALIEQYDTCTYLAPGWEGLVNGGVLELHHVR